MTALATACGPVFTWLCLSAAAISAGLLTGSVLGVVLARCRVRLFERDPYIRVSRDDWVRKSDYEAGEAQRELDMMRAAYDSEIARLEATGHRPTLDALTRPRRRDTA